MKPWLFMLALVPASYASAYGDIPLQGKIAGFVHKDHPRAKGGNFCYIAINDTAASFNNIYLRIEDSGMCRVAEVAYQLGEPVRAAEYIPGFPFVPAVSSLELKRDDRPHAFIDPRSQALDKGYGLKGPLSGYKAGKKGSCEIAIATEDARYSDAYHYVEDSRMCTLALAAYALRGQVSAVTKSRDATTKEIIQLEVTRGSAPYWPPYHVDSALSHYALHGPVGGYVLFKNDPSCFVSIKGDGPYNNGYHLAKDRSTCSTLLDAYFSGSPVAVGVKSLSNFNQIMRADLADDHKAYWPPYDSAYGAVEGVRPHDKRDELK